MIDPEPGTLGRLVDGLHAAGFYVDREAAMDALAERTRFNAIGPDAAKVDFIVRRDRPFSIEEFARRQPADLLGTAGFVTTVENLVIAKLEWAAASGSDRQLGDVAGILAVADGLDLAYIERWASAFGLTDAWRAAYDEARSR